MTEELGVKAANDYLLKIDEELKALTKKHDSLLAYSEIDRKN